LRVLAVVHQRDAGPGVLGEAAQADGHELIEWMAPDAPAPSLDGIDAALVLGGAMNVNEQRAHPWLVSEKAFVGELVRTGVPTLGICLGAQLLADAAGAEPRRATEPEIGWHAIELTDAAADDPLLGPLPHRLEVLSWHSYEAPLPPAATALAHSDVCLHAYRLASGRAWGVQFHPEVSDADLHAWLDGWRSDPDAVRIGIDPEAIRAASEPRLAAWHELGRDLMRRFLAAAAN
jgi:GMP synthase-like glutamine amidotransferase